MKIRVRLTKLPKLVQGPPSISWQSLTSNESLSVGLEVVFGM